MTQILNRRKHIQLEFIKPIIELRNEIFLFFVKHNEDNLDIISHAIFTQDGFPFLC